MNSESPPPDESAALRRDIERLTAAMEQAAEEGEWSRVAEAESERRPLLHTLLEGDYPEQDPQGARSWIEGLRARDATLLDRGREVRQQFLKELHYGAEAERAIRAYQRTDRGGRR